MQWIKLEDELPPDDVYCVLLFPLKSDVGILYHTSNPAYARVNAIKAGYTHWAKVENAPTHEQWVEWQDKLT